MPQPKGFVDKIKPNQICKLKKVLYRLREAPRHGLISLRVLKTLGDLKTLSLTTHWSLKESNLRLHGSVLYLVS